MSSDNETTSTDESYDWSDYAEYDEEETYGNHISDEEDIKDIDVVDYDDLTSVAYEYIDNIRFVFSRRNLESIDKLPRILWNRIFNILKDNFNNSEYNIVLCNLMHMAVSRNKKINRTIDCIGLFRRPEELAKYDKYRYFEDVEIMNLSQLKLADNYKDRYDMGHIDYMCTACRDIIVKRVFDSVGYSVIPNMRNPCHLWGHISLASIKVAIEITVSKLSNNTFLNNFVKFMEFFSLTHNDSYHEKYDQIRTIMRDNKTWKLCKNLVHIPYLFRIEKTLKELGFPSIATRYIREYLERTWLNTKKGKMYMI